MKKSSKLTEQFLFCISKHLSGRKDCKDQNYSVVIAETITIDPDIQVLPNRYDRKPGNRTSVIEHVLNYHFQEIVIIDKEGSFRVKPNSLVSGIYQYQSSINNKRRRWVRIK